MIKISIFKKNRAVTETYNKPEVSAQGLIDKHKLVCLYSDKPELPRGRWGNRILSVFAGGREDKI
jgi:hypothetical protein